MRRAHDSSLDGGEHRLDQIAFGLQVAVWRRTGDQMVHAREILGAAKLRRRRPKEDDRVAFGGEMRAGDAIEVVDQTDHADHRRRVDRARGTLVIEGHVAAGDGRP